jgi:hypothetical protein
MYFKEEVIMKKSDMIKFGVLISLGAFLGAGCTVQVAPPPPPAVAVSGEIYAQGPPPAPIYEAQVMAPGPGFVWIGGGWVWGGSAWRWETGRWARPPYRGAHWVAHQYVYRNGHHVFVRGGWR